MNNKPRILMIAPSCIPPSSPESIVTAKLVTAMSSAGWNIDLISRKDLFMYYPSDNYLKWFNINGKVFSISSTHNIFSKFVIPIFSANSKLLFYANLLYWTAHCIYLGIKLTIKNKYDFILSRSLPFWSHFPAYIVSTISRIPWIASWNDVEPSIKNLPPYGHGPFAPISFIVRNYLSSVCRKALSHIFCSERLRDYMCNYFPIGTSAKTEVIPHICLSSLSVSKQETSRFILTHSGILDEVRRVDVFIEGVRRFLISHPKAPLEIHWIGNISKSTIDKIELSSLQSYTCKGPVDYLQSLNLQSQATIIVIIEAACQEGIFLPSKFVDAVQIDKPVLAISPQVGTLNDILARYGGGIAADVHSPESVASCLSVFYQYWENGTLNNKFNHRFYRAVCNEKGVISKYREIFNKLEHPR